MGARPRRRGRPGRSGGRPRIRKPGRFAIPLLIATAAIATLAAVFLLGGTKRQAAPTAAPAKPPRASASARQPVPPVAAARPAPAAAPKLPATQPPQPARPEAPRAALLIDDLGRSIGHLHEVAALGTPVSIAILPGLDATGRTVREATALGIEVLLHLPMEPREEGGKDPGSGALLTSMSPEAIVATLRDDLAAVPGAVGVNNHMGSRFTADPAALALLMAELKRRGLFWVDSRTGADTRGFAVAQAHGVRAAERDIFIDATVEPEFVRGQLRKLVELARRRGAAIGIGHPHPETLAVLREMREELAASGVAWVPVSALLREGTAALAAAGR